MTCTNKTILDYKQQFQSKILYKKVKIFKVKIIKAKIICYQISNTVGSKGIFALQILMESNSNIWQNDIMIYISLSNNLFQKAPVDSTCYQFLK